MSVLKILLIFVVLIFESIAVTAIYLLSLGQGRRWLRKNIVSVCSKFILRILNVRMKLFGALPNKIKKKQFVYISNHTSALDIPIITSLGIPGLRYFLSYGTLKYLPMTVIGLVLGTFYLSAQTNAKQRKMQFLRALTSLRKSGESVFLTPEGKRITTGNIAHFNKGAFHLAINLGCNIIPLFIEIPKDMDPSGKGCQVKPGQINLHILPTISTQGWKESTVEEHAEQVRDLYIAFHKKTYAKR